MNPGFIALFFALCAGYVGYLIGLDVQYNRDRTKRDSIYTWTAPRGRGDGR